MSFFELQSEMSAYYQTFSASATMQDQRWSQSGNAAYDCVDEGFGGFVEDGKQASNYLYIGDTKYFIRPYEARGKFQENLVARARMSSRGLCIFRVMFRTLSPTWKKLSRPTSPPHTCTHRLGQRQLASAVLGNWQADGQSKKTNSKPVFLHDTTSTTLPKIRTPNRLIPQVCFE